MKLPKIGARVSDVGGARAHAQGPSSLLDKTGGSQIPKEGVALLPLVPPVLKKWALEKEKVENRGGLQWRQRTLLRGGVGSSVD